jgi:flagellar hook-associated protein 3 FlgL
MRIPSTSLARGATADLLRLSAEIDRARARVTTGKQLQAASDDPVAAAQVLAIAGTLRSAEQYRRNVATGRAAATAEEGVLDRLTAIIERAKLLAIGEASSTASATTRDVARAEVDQLLAQAVNLGNTRFEGEYLFGGDQAAAAPLTATTPPYTPSPAPSQRRLEIGAGVVIAPVRTAKELFVDTGALDSLRQLSAALGANDPAGIRSAIALVDGAHDAVQATLAENGGRAGTLDSTDEGLNTIESSLRDRRASLEEVDIEQAVTDLASRQTAYQAAMLATSRILSLSLTDYLR